ncbi:MAG: CRTAC1 family protein, partial [Flavobacteriaceae bacterium]|nr:VCBS repeat-containing protein [Eudoraea sp.]NNJ37914.1 CRTAC1 family protein [Flavobacteriaceae bacterium]
AIGTTALLYYGQSTVLQDVMPFRGFQSSMDYVMTIGLGQTEMLDSIRIIWPDDRTQKLEKTEANQFLTFAHSDTLPKYTPPKPEAIVPLIKEIRNTRLVSHEENNYNDFDYEGMIYNLLSQEGPALAIGDINGDGNEDIFIGGAKDQPGIIYQHLGKGQLKTIEQRAFEADMNFEDTAAAFLDADGDGDMDLIVGSGGNQVGDENTYRARLYLNDGRGYFTRSAEQLPTTFKNISVISPEDFDGDGDMDVFIGSRSVVGTYGVNPDHLFLENDGNGSFTNSAERLAYDLKDEGMVTDATWADMDGDGKKDLLTVSEWGTPKIYRNSGRRLSKLPSSLDSLSGWWNVVKAADLDNDGDQDLILGNQGTNLHYKPSPEDPMKIWINDFDNNGTIEQIVTQQVGDKDYPIHQKKELTNQMVALKKQNLKASDYARRSIDQLFPEEIFSMSIVKEAAFAESIIAINEGDGNFSIQALPSRVQLSCVCGISCVDINEDGYLDLIMGGNNFEYKPQFSRLDASYGNVLLNDGKLGFTWQDYNQSGFFVKAEIKHLESFTDKSGNRFVMAAINDDKPKIFALDD